MFVSLAYSFSSVPGRTLFSFLASDSFGRACLLRVFQIRPRPRSPRHARLRPRPPALVPLRESSADLAGVRAPALTADRGVFLANRSNRDASALLSHEVDRFHVSNREPSARPPTLSWPRKSALRSACPSARERS